MRKYILVLLVLSGVGAAQRFRIPILQRDPMDKERAMLHEKLTRLAETRKSLGMAETRSASALELDRLTASAQVGESAKRPTLPKPVKVRHPATANAWPPPPQAWTQGEQQPSLGEVARQERARKKQAASSSKQ